MTLTWHPHGSVQGYETMTNKRTRFTFFFFFYLSRCSIAFGRAPTTTSLGFPFSTCVIGRISISGISESLGGKEALTLDPLRNVLIATRDQTEMDLFNMPCIYAFRCEGTLL